MSTVTASKPVNLFASAKKQETKKASTRTKAEVVIKESEFEGISDIMKKLETDKIALAQLETDIANGEGEVKPLARNAFMKLYDEKKSRPDSFYITGEKGGKFLVIVMDKYSGVPDDARAEELRDAYGEDTVYTHKEFKFNVEILNRHMTSISEAIGDAVANIDGMTDEEKQSLLILSEKHYVSKNAIEKYMLIPEEQRVGYMMNINPQIQLKNTR